MTTVALHLFAKQQKTGAPLARTILDAIGVQPSTEVPFGKGRLRFYDQATLTANDAEFKKQLATHRKAGTASHMANLALARAALDVKRANGTVAVSKAKPAPALGIQEVSDENVITLGEIQVMRRILNRLARRNNGA